MFLHSLVLVLSYLFIDVMAIFLVVALAVLAVKFHRTGLARVRAYDLAQARRTHPAYSRARAGQSGRTGPITFDTAA